MRSTPVLRSRRLIAAVVLGGVALTACTGGTPSAKRVALDVVETMGDDRLPDGLTADQQQCMIDSIETYTDDELAAIGNAQENLALDFTETTLDKNASSELQAFVDDLESCRTGEPGTTTATTTAGSDATTPATTGAPTATAGG